MALHYDKEYNTQTANIFPNMLFEKSGFGLMAMYNMWEKDSSAPF